VNAPELSFILAAHNEEGNLRELVKGIREVVEPLGLAYEIVITDDGSTDRSWSIIKELGDADPRIRAVRFAANRGKTAALVAAFAAARGRVFVTMDADLQNDPRDLPKFLAALKTCDCTCGSRVECRRAGDSFVRTASSRIANAVRNKLSGETISDAGCGYLAFRRECVAKLKLFEGGHRFLSTLIRMEGYTLTEVPVRNNPRFAGQAHYGVWNRLFKSSADLLAVRWMKKRFIRYEIAERINE
jgi:glycosyltransferase involved in cell wall biosynthesis